MSQKNPVASITELKDLLAQDIEEFKKVSEAGVIKATTQYRQTLLELHQSGLQLTQALWKIGEKFPADDWAGEFCKRSVDLDIIEKDRAKMQAKMWDKMLLPLMNAEDTDKMELETVEKKLKSLSSQIESQAKKEVATFKKKSKKGDGNETQLQSTLEDLRQKQEAVNLYFEIYKEHRYAKWCKLVCQGFEAQLDHYEKGDRTLGVRPWQDVLAVAPPPLEDLEELLAGMAITTGSLSPPTSPRGTEPYVSTATPAESEVDVSQFWEEGKTPDGIVYYYNTVTQVTKWQKP